ncbi:MAG: SEC-C metal-binding domain-containing protein [Tepidanaerobacteraceae bacterium]|nr:SEC-C metal-binding domain-containing protein [Tepidanaerobacteraceae bacterium]
MGLSKIALNRVYEDSIKKGITSVKDLKKKGKTVLSDVKKLKDEEIIDKLNNLGVQIEKTTFSSSIINFPSAEAYYLWLMNEKKLKLNDKDEDILWMGITVLWERWFPELRNFEMLDDKIYEGYMLSEKGKSEEACNIWWDVWNDIIHFMNRYNISGIDAFDEVFRGNQYISNWVFDFENELHNAGINNPDFMQKRIDFCSDYLKISEDIEQLNIENMRRAMAESYILLGKQKEGDALFESFLKDNPQWGWGWINWSDCYWLSHKNNDSEKAEAILKKALSIKGLMDREDVLERLMNFYDENDRKAEADVIERELKELLEKRKLKNNKIFTLKNTQQVKRKKIGRNEPCPCGSGKKYKKCCGR